MRCDQCGKPAVVELQGHPLCVEHHNMMQQNFQASLAANAAMINYLGDSINNIFGLPPRGPRIKIPQPVIQNAPVTYHNINVADSVIGTINTGQVARIDVAMDNIQNSGDSEVSSAIKELTEAVVASTEIKNATRDELIEQLAFLAEQAALPTQQRQGTIIKTILKTIPATIGTAASLGAIWAQWGGHLEAFFRR